MATNTIDFGKIYDSTWFGDGVTSNSISWGSVYESIATGLSATAKAFVTRVEADGGTVESAACIDNANLLE